MKIRGNTIGTPLRPGMGVVKATQLTEEEKAQARENIGAADPENYYTKEETDAFLPLIMGEIERYLRDYYAAYQIDNMLLEYTKWGEVVTSVNGIAPGENGEITIPTGITKTLLWENAAPASFFDKQSIACPAMHIYDELEIEFIVTQVNTNDYVTATLTRCTVSTEKDAFRMKGNAVGFTENSPSTICSRAFSAAYSNSGGAAVAVNAITFERGYANTSVNPGRMIPYKIYGIKGVQ